MKPRDEFPPLDEKASAFISGLQKSERTRETYSAGLGAFQKFRLDQLKARRAGHSPALLALRGLDADVLVDFRAWLTAKGYSRFSQGTYIAAVVAFLERALDRGWLPATFSLDGARRRLKDGRRAIPYPSADVSLLPIPGVLAYWNRQPQDFEQKEDLLDLLRARAFVQLLYSSAGRIGEICRLDRKDVQDGRRDRAQVIGKGEKPRFIYILPEARAAISAYVDTRADAFEPLFIRHHREYGLRATRQLLWRTVHQAARALGTDVHPHDFRHYRASQMLDQGAPLEAIQEILGHADISTTRRIYAQYSRPAIRAIFEQTSIPASALGEEV